MNQAKKVLIFSPMSNWGGGVVEYVDSLKTTLNNSINFEDFHIGRRSARLAGIFSALLTTVNDVLRLIRKLHRNQYDVIHINPSFDRRSLIRDGIFLLILRIMGLKNSLVFIHGWNKSEIQKVKQSRARTFLLRQTFGSAAVISVLAEEFKRELVSLGLTKEKIIISTTMYNAEAIRPNRQAEHKIFRVVFMSRFVKEKGLFELVNAFREIMEEDHNFELVLAGDGPLKGQIEQWVKENDASDYIKLTGYLRGDDKFSLLNSADLFILPTYHGEGCPVAILEAMAAGLPILSTPVGAISELLDSDYQLLPVRVTSSSIRSNISRMASDRSRLKMIGEMNQARATQNYSAPIVSGKMKQIYDQLSA